MSRVDDILDDETTATALQHAAREVSSAIEALQSELGMLTADLGAFRTTVSDAAREAGRDLAQTRDAAEAAASSAGEIQSHVFTLATELPDAVGNIRLDIEVLSKLAAQAVREEIASANGALLTLVALGGVLQLALLALILWRIW